VSGPRVLVVDDQPLVGRALRRHLIAAGCDVRVVEDGERGLEECLEWKPAVVIVDRRLPKLAGDALAARIASEMSPAPAVFLVTGDTAHLGSVPGVVEVFSKPVRFDALHAAIRPYLEASK
jgi:DNA-binding response OmpR family regulator